MKYAYHDLSTDQFESLVVAVCQFLLGVAVQGFTVGPDGGRDAKFVGTAELHPSRAEPWKGTVIVQAKHTNGLNKRFSDSDFFSENSAKTVIAKELPRIKKLREAKRLDHYMLFSNRRLTGMAESAIRAHISTECNLPEQSVYLCGVEQVELYLKRFPRAAQIANIDPIDSPLITSPEELADLVEVLSKNLPAVSAKLENVPTDRMSYEEKNQINKMSEEYARKLRKYYLKETQQIREFLSDPQNEELLTRYLAVVEEFQLKVVAKRKDYHTFDDVMNYLFDLLFERDAVLRGQPRLTRTVVFYMYWNCDLGEDSDAQT
jgi:hypothetical protein